jgi:glycosyltransferase involved in cell wall biosynthesis
MKVSIIVRAHNEEQHIGKLLFGIAAQRLKAHEIVLVDSGSTDATVEIARRHGCKIVPISRHEFTFGRALNRGCAAATGDMLVFVSAHVYPLHQDWLEKLVSPFEDERVVLTYGRQQGGDVNKFSEHQIFARWYPAQSCCPQRTYFCNNANAAIRRSVWETLPYDETLTGLEDLAWAKQAQSRGGWVAYVADAEIVHLHDETWDQVQNRYHREAMALRAIDEHAKFTRIDLGGLLVRNVMSDMAVALQKKVLRKEAGSILKFRYRQLLGTWRGFNGPPQATAELKSRLYYPSNGDAQVHPRAQGERPVIDYDVLMGDAESDSGAIPLGDGEGHAARAAPLRVVRGDR